MRHPPGTAPPTARALTWPAPCQRYAARRRGSIAKRARFAAVLQAQRPGQRRRRTWRAATSQAASTWRTDSNMTISASARAIAMVGHGGRACTAAPAAPSVSASSRQAPGSTSALAPCGRAGTSRRRRRSHRSAQRRRPDTGRAAAAAPGGAGAGGPQQGRRARVRPPGSPGPHSPAGRSRRPGRPWPPSSPGRPRWRARSPARGAAAGGRQRGASLAARPADVRRAATARRRPGAQRAAGRAGAAVRRMAWGKAA